MNVHNVIDDYIKSKQPKHPFENVLDKNNVEVILSEYLGLCMCAPYIIGGSNAKLFIDTILNNGEIDKKIEITTAISSFLSFDETGNYKKVIENGHRALSSLLDTTSFHSNLLKEDLKFLFKKEIKPVTKQYLKNYFVELSTGLSSTNNIERCAALVALEVHSEIMIMALWNTLSTVFPEIDKNDLNYFYLHVGGDNPAEEYHVEITEMMIKEVVGYENVNSFMTYFETFYSANIALCDNILSSN